MTSAPAAMIYYMHPLLAGPIGGWDRHFERCAAMGFRQVMLGPPFRTGRSGDLFLTADHLRMDERLGGGDAVEMLARTGAKARALGLELLLDLVVDRVAAEHKMADGSVYHTEAPGEFLPDPRREPANRFAATLRDPDAASAWWSERIASWLEAGVAGFRCDAPHRVSPEFWTRLITGARTGSRDARFIAWTIGADPAAVRAMRGCGFDAALSSSWAWDFQAPWLDAEMRLVGGVGDVLAAAELPFGARVAANAVHPERAAKRALAMAAFIGQDWLMPMGFEFGATQALNPRAGDADAFLGLAREPHFDLSAPIAEANAMHAGLSRATPGRIVSAPYAPICAVERRDDKMAGGRLLFANARLDHGATLDVSGLVSRIDGVLPADAALPQLFEPGAVLGTSLVPRGAVTVQTGTEPAAKAATSAARIAIENVQPAVENGRFASKQIVGSSVEVTADIFCDGHDTLAACVVWRAADAQEWHQVPMRPIGNDRWSASFPLDRTGRHVFVVEAWVDVLATSREEIAKKHAAGVNVDVELKELSELLASLAKKNRLLALQALVREVAKSSNEALLTLLMTDRVSTVLAEADPRLFKVRSAPERIVDAERVAAGFGSWYEIFPRSQGGPERHGTFDDVIAKLPDIRDMGFDVLYFPPIHPIGEKNRKGRNNALRAEPGDVGSPYAIGAAEGGHDAVHPQLGTIEDFRRLCQAASAHGMEIALDFAIQCSPDHPWLRQHPEWFSWRPDGTIKYAENPPKKYEDIVNVAFYAEGAKPALWQALRDVVLFWVREGVRIFRVDNPHTKPLPFWEWLIAEVRGQYPDVIFLAEAFTRPKMMYRLAKIGFSQSYTYFTWRNTAFELREYLTELTTTAPSLFFRPHFFVNTPDINPVFLHGSGRAGHLLRAALAATLSGLWGVYNGFEICEARSLNGREEYLDSEKYQLRQWDLRTPGNIVDEIRQLNHIRRTNPALHSHLGVRFIDCGNERVLCYVKSTPGQDNILLVAVSFDPQGVQETDIELRPAHIGLEGPADLILDDLMTGQSETGRTGWRHIRLDPATLPFAIWLIRSNIQE